MILKYSFIEKKISADAVHLGVGIYTQVYICMLAFQLNININIFLYLLSQLIFI